MTRRITVADAALFCSLLLGIGFLAGFLGHVYVTNVTAKNRKQWAEEISASPASKPNPYKGTNIYPAYHLREET